MCIGFQPNLVTKTGHQMELVRPGNPPRHLLGTSASCRPLHQGYSLAFYDIIDAHPLVCDPCCKSSSPSDVGNWSFTLAEHLLLIPSKYHFLMHRQLVLHPRHDSLARVFPGIDRVNGNGGNRTIHAEVEGVVVTVESGDNHSTIVGAGGVELSCMVNGHLQKCTRCIAIANMEMST